MHALVEVALSNGCRTGLLCISSRHSLPLAMHLLKGGPTAYTAEMPCGKEKEGHSQWGTWVRANMEYLFPQSYLVEALMPRDGRDTARQGHMSCRRKEGR